MCISDIKNESNSDIAKNKEVNIQFLAKKETDSVITEKDNSSEIIGSVSGAVIGLIALVLVVVAFVLVKRRRRRNRPRRRADQCEGTVQCLYAQ